MPVGGFLTALGEKKKGRVPVSHRSSEMSWCQAFMRLLIEPVFHILVFTNV